MELIINKNLHKVTFTKRDFFYMRENVLDVDSGITTRTSDGCDYDLFELEIGEGITCIGEGVFENCKSLTKVILPASVKIIRQNAFAGCTALKTVITPDTLKEVEYQKTNGSKTTSFDLTPSDLTNGSEIRLLYDGDDDPHHWD